METLCRLAGTVDSEEKSVQIQGGILGDTQTGLGNLRLTKEMVLEYDVLKRLQTGQAVVVQKNPFSVDLIQTAM